VALWGVLKVAVVATCGPGASATCPVLPASVGTGWKASEGCMLCEQMTPRCWLELGCARVAQGRGCGCGQTDLDEMLVAPGSERRHGMGQPRVG